MISKWTTAIYTVLIVSCLTLAQENADRNVSPSLKLCYRDPFLSVKDNLLPHTIDTFINLIRKIENYKGLNLGLTELSVSLIHRFRQDGIIRDRTVLDDTVVSPYSASTFQFEKHSLLLKKLLPGNARNFPNETLTPIEQCSIHSMLSISIDPYKRNDEAQRCNQLANYRAMRVPRSIKDSDSINLKRNHLVDVEIVSKNSGKAKPETFGKMQVSPTEIPQKGKEDDDYGDDYDELPQIPKQGVDAFDFTNINSQQISECPVENGVVKTRWGTVSIGNVISGIATGLENQKVQLSVLMRSRGRQQQQQPNVAIDIKWAATLAGDLSEVVLLQIAKNPKGNVNIGANGAWNSSTLPNWYFISQRDKYEMTDAEIRGDIDGLIIAQKIREWQSRDSNLRLSQVLDMYYSQKGVFDTKIRACDRKKLFKELINTNELIRQTIAFAKILRQNLVHVPSINEEGYEPLTTKAVKELEHYIDQSLNDVSCESTAPKPNSIETEIATDMIIYIDTTWPYKDIKELVGYVLDKINLDGKTSSVTIFSGTDGIMSNTTHDIGSAKGNWTEEIHQKHANGFNLKNILISLENITRQYMLKEYLESDVGGRSLVVLFVPNMVTLNEGESDYFYERLQRIREQVPDLRPIFFAGGDVKRFDRFVDNKIKDLIPAMVSSTPLTVVTPVVERLTELSRRIINPRCGKNWDGDTGVSQFKQCITPGTIKYYRIMPNYFYTEHGNRKIKIQSQQGTSSVTICTSRNMEDPRSNSTANKPDDLDCKPVITNAFELEITNPCSGIYEIHKCNPLYLSVEASDYTDTTSIINDPECRSAGDIPLQITAEHLTCHSGVGKVFKGSLLFIIISWLTLWYRS